MSTGFNTGADSAQRFGETKSSGASCPTGTGPLSGSSASGSSAGAATLGSMAGGSSGGSASGGSSGSSEQGTVREMGERIRETAEDTLRRVQEAAPEYYEQGREKLSEITSSVEEYIRREPLKAALIAAGVGLCVGVCLMRR